MIVDPILSSRDRQLEQMAASVWWAIMSDSHEADGTFTVDAIDCPFDNLAALHARWPGNRLGQKFPVDLTLEVEEFHLSIPAAQTFRNRIASTFSKTGNDSNRPLRLRVRLRHCYVRYRSSEIQILSSSKYQFRITEAKYELTKSEQLTESRRRGRGGNTSASASLTRGGISGSLKADANLSGSNEANRKLDFSTLAQPELFEVQAVPNGWRIGHPALGDPNKIDNCLDGQYFRRSADRYPQTCEAEFLSGCKSGRITFLVTIRDGLHLTLEDGNHCNESTAKDGKLAMREKLAAIRLERYLSSSNKDSLHLDDEVPLAIVTCNITQATDADSSLAPTPNSIALTPLEHSLESPAIQRRAAFQIP
jgi:hypothetical protein